MAVLLEEASGRVAEVQARAPARDTLHAIADATGLGVATLCEGVEAALGEGPFPTEPHHPDPGHAAGYLLAWSDLGGCDPAVWRAVARRLAFVAGAGDRGLGATSLRASNSAHPLLATLRATARAVLATRGLRGVEDRLDALCRSLARELACVAVETTMGIGPALLLTATHQEEASRQPPVVQAAMGRLLAERGEEVHGKPAFERLLARALDLVRTGSEDRPLTAPPDRQDPLRPTWDRMMRGIARTLDHAREMIRRLGLPCRVVLVPVGFLTPEDGEVAPPPLTSISAPEGRMEEERRAASHSRGERGEPPQPPNPRWGSRIRKSFRDLVPFLTPRLREYLPGIV